MSEASAIERSPAPRTRQSLAADLRAIGLPAGGIAMVHCSLNALGWVCGGPVAVIEALLDVLGPGGTLVMPSHSSQLTDPAKWGAPPVPPEWIDTIRAQMPPYDPATTPTRGMGAVAELFRTWPDARRSFHPSCSFAAIGPRADEIVARHELDSPLGEESPLARLYDANAMVLLLGVGFDRCTILHLAEQRAWPDRRLESEGAPLVVEGERRWVNYRAAPTLDPEHFWPIGQALLDIGVAKRGSVGSAGCYLTPARQAVDYAVSSWRDCDPASFASTS